VQSGHIDVWGVQLEVGSVATPLEKLDPAIDFANCLRFFQTGAGLMFGYGAAGTFVAHGVQLPVVMRANPAILAANWTTVTNINAEVFSAVWNGAISLQGNVVATGAWGLEGNYQISAEL
jgi:hypothetical protein